ncbi:MAG: thioredoxin domain-containing protein, partial [Acetobacteraceae bacterium]|nr:thioredoxin domain-containing protein [Acetobacteraceae bacterium]
RNAGDNATPSGIGLMAEVLARLHHLTGDEKYRQRAQAVIAAFSGRPDALGASPTLLAAADLLERGACVVVAGDPESPAGAALLRTALASPDPAVCVLRAPRPDALPPAHPAHGKTATATARAFVCRNQSCGLPVTYPAALAEALAGPGDGEGAAA